MDIIKFYVGISITQSVTTLKVQFKYGHLITKPLNFGRVICFLFHQYQVNKKLNQFFKIQSNWELSLVFSKS